MRAADIKSYKYRDNLASQRRRHFLVKASVLAVLAIVVLGGIGFALFFTPWLKIDSVAVNGLDQEHTASVQADIVSRINRKFLGIPFGRNILFLSKGSVETNLMSEFPFIHDLSVDKEYPHTLAVNATERHAEGVWCFTAIGICRYFDHDGVTWGDALQSSGFLLLSIDDMRDQAAAKVDSRFLTAIEEVVKGLDADKIKVKRVSIPSGSFTEFDIATNAAYPLKFSLDSSLSAQLDVFRIFKTKKIDTGLATPQYLDLRYDGRVYYK